MCLALPGKLLEIVDPEARHGRVDILGTPRIVNLSLMDEVAPGDWVLVRMGFAMERISEAEAAETVRLFEELEAAIDEAASGGVGEAGS